MGLFSRKYNAAAHAEATRRADARFAETMATSAKREAERRAQKWDRITRSMTARGEDHEGRDYAIHARDRARRDAAAAETRALNAKYRR